MRLSAGITLAFIDSAPSDILLKRSEESMKELAALAEKLGRIQWPSREVTVHREKTAAAPADFRNDYRRRRSEKLSSSRYSKDCISPRLSVDSLSAYKKKLFTDKSPKTEQAKPAKETGHKNSFFDSTDGRLSPMQLIGGNKPTGIDKSFNGRTHRLKNTLDTLRLRRRYISNNLLLKNICFNENRPDNIGKTSGSERLRFSSNSRKYLLSVHLAMSGREYAEYRRGLRCA